MMNRNSSEFVCDTLEHLDILNSFLQLFIGVNRQPFCELLNQFLTFLPLISLHRSPMWSPRWCIGWECFSSSTSASLFWGTTMLFVYSSFWVISTLDVLVLLSTLEIVHRDVLVLLNVVDVHQCSKVDFPCLLLVCAVFFTSFHSFFIVAFASGSTLLGWKIFCSCFSVSRSMRLWETDLQSLLNHK